MLVITSVIFHKMCFPHEGNIVTIDQLTYYKPESMISPEFIISSMSNNYSSTPLTDISPDVYKGSSLFGAFPGPPPLILEPNSLSVCMLQASQLPSSSLVHLIYNQILNTLWLPSQQSHMDPLP